jgi:hypothetical protein
MTALKGARTDFFRFRHDHGRGSSKNSLSDVLDNPTLNARQVGANRYSLRPTWVAACAGIERWRIWLISSRWSLGAIRIARALAMFRV